MFLRDGLLIFHVVCIQFAPLKGAVGGTAEQTFLEYVATRGFGKRLRSKFVALND